MNKQRKVLITTTYNEMGIIIDTKAEEVAQPNLQLTCNQFATDTISRQAVLDKKELVELEDGQSFYCISPEDVETLPSVTPQPKTGHWEQYGNSWEDKFKCSECGKEQPKILCGERIIGHWSDYCPNCGARMIEPQEREE